MEEGETMGGLEAHTMSCQSSAKVACPRQNPTVSRVNSNPAEGFAIGTGRVWERKQATSDSGSAREEDSAFAWEQSNSRCPSEGSVDLSIFDRFHCHTTLVLLYIR